MEQHKANPDLKKGDFVVNRYTRFPGIVQDNYVQRNTRLTEVWGIEHEWGSQWADELAPISKDEFETFKRLHQPEWGKWEK